LTTLSPDTDPETEKLQIEGLRQMPPWRKTALVSSMNRMVRCLVPPDRKSASPTTARPNAGAGWQT
jgi:hypothetical protein